MTRSRSTSAVFVCALALLIPVAVLGADASAVPLLLEGGDPRSDGAGPGLVGSPLVVLGAVALVGLATALLTALLVRLTQRD